MELPVEATKRYKEERDLVMEHSADNTDGRDDEKEDAAGNDAAHHGDVYDVRHGLGVRSHSDQNECNHLQHTNRLNIGVCHT